MSAGTTCEQVRASAGELALGVVSGRERAGAVEHLAGCPSCHELVADLAPSADELLLLAPAAEPPAGFEDAVLARLRPPAPPAAALPPRASATAPVPPIRTRRHRSRTRALVLAAAVLLVVLAGAAAAVVATRGHGPTAVARTRSAPMTSAAGDQVGRAVLTGRPDSLIVVMPGWRRLEPDDHGDTYHLRADAGPDGTRDLGPVRLVEPSLTWSTTVPVDVRNVRTVALVDEGGRVLCTATFTR